MSATLPEILISTSAIATLRSAIQSPLTRRPQRRLDIRQLPFGEPPGSSAANWSISASTSCTSSPSSASSSLFAPALGGPRAGDQTGAGPQRDTGHNKGGAGDASGASNPAWFGFYLWWTARDVALRGHTRAPPARITSAASVGHGRASPNFPVLLLVCLGVQTTDDDLMRCRELLGRVLAYCGINHSDRSDWPGNGVPRSRALAVAVSGPKRAQVCTRTGASVTIQSSQSRIKQSGP